MNTNLQALMNTVTRQLHACVHILIFILHEVFLYALPKFGLLPKPSDSTLLSFSKDTALKLGGRKPVNLSCRKRCYNLNEKQQADRKKGAGTKLRQSLTFFVPAG